MKNSVILFLLLNLLMACGTVPLDNTKIKSDIQSSISKIDKNSDENFLALQARAEVDDLTLNYSELRKAFTQSSYYQPYGSDERKLVEQNFKFFSNEEYALCLQNAENLLAKNFISLGGHYVTAICAKALDLEEKAYLHEEILEGLFDSISKSGDGRSLDSAYVVYTTEELYTFLQLNGFNVIGQDIINENDKVFESMQLSANNSEEKFTLLFDITTQWQLAFSALKDN